MGLFGGKDDTKAKIDELKAKMQQGAPQQQYQAQPQPWQQPQQQYQPPQQTWQPPREQQPEPEYYEPQHMGDENGIILDLGDGMSLNLPVKSRMRLDEFLRIADRVRELKKIEHQQHY
jgi:hypothetical protein